MKRILIIALTTTLTVFSFVGCTNKVEEKQSSTISASAQEQNDLESEKLKEEESRYGALLSSSKTYEEMSEVERGDFEKIIQNLDNFTEEFKKKYKDNIDKIEVSKKEYIEKVEAEKEEITSAQTIKRENIIGKSNKNFNNIDNSKPVAVRNDKTGNWKIMKISSSENILEYAKSYYDNNFSNDDEIHAVINFAKNTTANISYLFDNIISVTIHEYVSREEHSADRLFGGTVLGEYWIYMDNGDIEEVM